MRSIITTYPDFQALLLNIEAFVWTLDRIRDILVGDMNTSLVKSAPQGDFVEISVLMRNWQIKFQASVSQKRPIKYDMYPMPDIPPEFKNRLNQQGYQDLILENDRWQHYLVPNSN